MYKHPKHGWIKIQHTFQTNLSFSNALVTNESGRSFCIDLNELEDCEYLEQVQAPETKETKESKK
jgi:hypothetical protein